MISNNFSLLTPHEKELLEDVLRAEAAERNMNEHPGDPKYYDRYFISTQLVSANCQRDIKLLIREIVYLRQEVNRLSEKLGELNTCADDIKEEEE